VARDIPTVRESLPVRVYAPEKVIRENLSPTFLAWAAGFIDGEGNIHAHRARNDNTGPAAAVWKVRLRLTVAQKPREALDLLQQTFGVGSIRQVASASPRTGLPSHLHLWNVNTRQAEQVIRAVLPYLVVKREAALVALRAAGYESG